MLTTIQLQRFAQKTHSLQDSPCLLVDTSIIQDKCRIFKELFPEVSLFYALKCFSNTSVVDSVDGLVDGYDVASVREIETLLENGVNPSRLRYSNPVKAETAIHQAALLGVNQFAFQSESELQKISKRAPGSAVYLRLDVASAKKSIDFSSKFGAAFEDAVELLSKASELRLIPLGVTFHVGSQAEDTDAWINAIARAADVVRMSRDIGVQLQEINIGGGFPVQYNSTSMGIDELATVINEALDKVRSEFPGLKIIAEPGRFIVADSGVIVTTVIGKETRGTKPWLYLDTGAFQSFFEIFEFGKFFYPVHSLKHLGHSVDLNETIDYALTGPTCDSYDTMTKNIKLPAGLEINDKLLISMTGAYTLAYGSEFNGFDLPKVVFLQNRQRKLSSRRVSTKTVGTTNLVREGGS